MMKHPAFAFLVVAISLVLGCSEEPKSKPANPDGPTASVAEDQPAVEADDHMEGVTVAPYGTTPDGEKVEIYTLTNDKKMTAQIITFGATLVRLELPDREGKIKNVVLGYDDLEGYLADTSYLGTAIGRYGNRIAGGRFVLEKTEYELATNNDENHLHGGNVGFGKRVWKAQPASTDADAAVKFSYTSPDGEEGYPGELSVSILFTLSAVGELRFDYFASTTKTTHCNLTHHSYFNLAGHDSGDVLDQELTLPSEHYLPTDEGLIPTGEIKRVEGTPMDFRKAKKIGAQIDQEAGLYDLCFVVPKSKAPLSFVASASDPASGRVMNVFTNEPGVQFYTANHLDNVQGIGGTIYQKHHGFCLETQHYPDSPNQPDFPSTILKPGERYRSTTIHRFSTY